MEKKRATVFRFKKFNCSHGLGSMKIGVDAVLLGAWADVAGALRILDVGTGCGVIALMCAQRNNECSILGIDIDPASVAEAASNFKSSPWSSRLHSELREFTELADSSIKVLVEEVSDNNLNTFDLIISNPPYFNSGIDNPDTPRLVARHSAVLSPHSLLTEGAKMLADGGAIAIVVPAEQREELERCGREAGLMLRRLTLVKGHPDAPVKRALMEFRKSAYDSMKCEENLLVLETAPGVPTDDHRKLCRDFYLKF